VHRCIFGSTQSNCCCSAKLIAPFLLRYGPLLSVNSSHGHLVTRSTHHRSTHHTRVSSHSQLVTSEHNKATSRKKNYLHAGQVAPRNSAQHGRPTSLQLCTRRGKKWDIVHTCPTWQVIAARAISRCKFFFSYTVAISKSPTTAKLLNATNARSRSTVNSSQRRQTRRSTRHTILRCDELTVWRVDLLPGPSGRVTVQSWIPLTTRSRESHSCIMHELQVINEIN